MTDIYSDMKKGEALIRADEKQKLLAEVESWLVDEDTRRAMLKRENLMELASVLSKNQLRAELRAKVQEMKGKL